MAGAILFLAMAETACRADKINPQTDSNGTKSNNSAALQSQKKQIVMLASAKSGAQALEISADKIDAALQLATQISGNFEAIPLGKRDSLVKILGKEATALTIAKQLDVDQLLFVRVDRMENIIRLALTVKFAPDFTTSAEAVGFALIRSRNEKTGVRMTDPALLEALQRALCQAEKNPALFAQAQGTLRVLPAEPLVVGGIDFQDKGITPKWSIFEEKIVVSFDAVQQIFRAAKNNPNFVVYDTDTRDSIFAMKNLFMLENYRSPSVLELKILEQFEVRKYITGTLARTAEGAKLTLFLCSISGGKLTTIKSESAVIESDKRADFNVALKKVTEKILE